MAKTELFSRPTTYPLNVNRKGYYASIYNTQNK